MSESVATRSPAVGATDVGRRKHNEDAFFIDTDLGLMLVADGVGGHQAGEVASAITCATLAQEAAGGESLDTAIRSANREIMAAVQQGQGREGMATTVVATRIHGADYELAWVGDSRAYLYDGKLKLLTRDHSLVEALVARGEITQEEAKDHPQRNVIVQAVGLQAEDNLRVGFNRGQLQAGEILILCSDGMSDILDNQTIVEILTGDGDLESRCQKLVSTSIEQGGRDNSTVVLVEGVETLANGADVLPEVVWSYDPASGQVSGTREVEVTSAAPQLKKVDSRDPQSTQMMSVDEVEKALAAQRTQLKEELKEELSQNGREQKKSPARYLLWVLLAAIIAGGLFFSLDVLGLI